jgi:hypothetical protein
MLVIHPELLFSGAGRYRLRDLRKQTTLLALVVDADYVC